MDSKFTSDSCNHFSSKVRVNMTRGGVGQDSMAASVAPTRLLFRQWLLSHD